MDNAFEDFEQVKTITDLSEILDTIEFIGVPWEIKIVDGESHILLLDMNGEGTCELIFDENEAFREIVKPCENS